jgi:hypothetical protein
MRLTCRIAMLNAGQAPAVFTDAGEAQRRIGSLFGAASGDDIDLVMSPSGWTPQPAPAGFPVTALDLHFALTGLVGLQRPGRVTTIGLLLAASYKHFPKALGVMFDRGMATIDDPNAASQFTGVPREGCAVFLDAIETFRNTPQDRDIEAAFTAIHELGHVFNLQHTSRELTYLSASSPAGPYALGSVDFNDEQRRWLAQCSTSDRVAPGGTPFEDVGPGSPVDPEAHFSKVRDMRAGPGDRFGLELTIGMSRREFWQFEPVDLDVRLSVMPGLKRRYRVPDMVDPGYSVFSLLIENPAGERRKFKPAVRYCPHNHVILIAPGRPFERDIAIFRDTEGYTFRGAGIHKIHAAFELRPGHVLTSNTLEVNILRETGRDEVRDIARRALVQRDSRIVLYHRQDLPDRKGIRLLSEYLDERKPKGPGTSAVRYALGRACLSHSARRYKQPPEKVRHRGRDELKRAIDSGDLSRHWAEVAGRLLKTEDTRERVKNG